MGRAVTEASTLVTSDVHDTPVTVEDGKQLILDKRDPMGTSDVTGMSCIEESEQCLIIMHNNAKNLHPKGVEPKSSFRQKPFTSSRYTYRSVKLH